MRFDSRALTIARLTHGYSQRQLADRSGVSHTTIQSAEKGVYTPRPESVLALADALGLSPLDLYTEDVAA